MTEPTVAAALPVVPLRGPVPTLALDHLVLSTTDLERGADALAQLGIPLDPGGAHPLMGTHNRLLSLGPDLYLELVAVDPAASPPGRPRWLGLDRFSGPVRLTHWVIASDDLDASAAAAPDGVGSLLDVTRGDLTWTMTVPDTGVLPLEDRFPALIQWRGSAHPTGRLTDRGFRLRRLEISHPEADRLRAGLPGFDDPRVAIVVGPSGMTAVLDTPRGQMVLPC